VLFGKYSGSDVELDGEEYKILRESEILGVIENNQALYTGRCKRYGKTNDLSGRGTDTA